MKILALGFSGFCGVPHDSARRLVIGHFGQFTIFIGPNNSGKSSVLRMLMRISQWFQSSEHMEDQRLQEHEFWRHDDSTDVYARITVELQPFSIADHLNESGIICPDNTIDCQFAIGKSHSSMTVLNSPDDYDKQSSKDHRTPAARSEDQAHLKSELFSLIGQSFHFFDPIRALDRDKRAASSNTFFGARSKAADLHYESGSKLLEELAELESNPKTGKEWHLFEDQLIRRLNTVFEPSGMPAITTINIKTGGVLHIHNEAMRHVPIPIEMLGTGISQLIIVLSFLVLHGNRPAVVCIEEPESNLHPGLLRKFIEQLREFTCVQFILTTHSHVLLDCLEPDDQVYHFNQNADGICSAKRCEGIQDKHGLLDTLGIRASSLLQVNCVIWVEGPSDRLYIRHWIDCLDGKMKEGKDYSFLFYGGSALSHLGLSNSDDLDSELIAMMQVSRFAIVVMDSDLPAGHTDDDLSKAKRSIVDAAKKDTDHRLAVVSISREIENDISQEILKDACSEMLGFGSNKIQHLELTGNEPFEKEIADEFLKVEAEHFMKDGEEDKDKVKELRGILKNKVRIAKKIVDKCERTGVSMNPPDYAMKIVHHVRKSGQIDQSTT